MSFATEAMRLAGLSARLLGWRPDEFWRATPAELTLALCDPVGEASEALDRKALNAMMECDPDGK